MKAFEAPIFFAVDGGFQVGTAPLGKSPSSECRPFAMPFCTDGSMRITWPLTTPCGVDLRHLADLEVFACVFGD